MCVIIFFVSVYFKGVMVRLMLVLAPVACILAGIGISSVLSTYMKVGTIMLQNNLFLV